MEQERKIMKKVEQNWRKSLIKVEQTWRKKLQRVEQNWRKKSRSNAKKTPVFSFSDKYILHINVGSVN